MDFNNIIFNRVICFLAAVFIICGFAGCVSGPIVASNEEIGILRNAYSELETRYFKLESDYSELISRQQSNAIQQSRIITEQSRIITEQSETTDRIGTNITELDKTTRNIEFAIDGISDNNREIIRLIQQYLKTIGIEGFTDR